MTPAITFPSFPRLLSDPNRVADLVGRAPWAIDLTARVREEGGAALAKLEAVHDKLCDIADAVGRPNEMNAIVRELWELACVWARAYQQLLVSARQFSRDFSHSNLVAALTEQVERLADLMRTMAVVWEEMTFDTPDDIYGMVWSIRIPLGARLRAMCNLLWSAIRHPLSETTIDLSTGRVLYRE